MKKLVIITLSILFQFSLSGQENSIMKVNDCIPEFDTINGQEVYYIVDTFPSYPKISLEIQNIALNCLDQPVDNSVYYGIIYYTFIIDTTGSVCMPCVSKSIIRDDVFFNEEEFINSLEKMGKWNPGILSNKKVPVRIQTKIKIGS